MTNRYVGRPFLRLLECYVLVAIGQLETGHAEILRCMEPKLEQTYGMTGTWLEIVRAQMELPDSLPEKIHSLWERNVELAKAHGVVIDPNQFATSFVDQNFPEAIC